MFENIAGNKSLQFDSQLKAHVEALTNLASGQLTPKKAVFRPEALLVTSPTTYWTFISLNLF